MTAPPWTHVVVAAAASLIVAALFALSFVHVRWGYDEFGAVISHQELDDPAFVAEYDQYARAIGLSSEASRSLFVNVVLPVGVVPIRWTYALGVSSWLGVARWLPLDWPALKPVLMLPSILLAALGLWLALRITSPRTGGSATLPVFLAIVASSAPLFWWIETLSSYSHHLFCFGLLMYASLAEPRVPEDRWLGRRSLARAAAPIFNYQYVPIVALLGLLDFGRDPRGFLRERRYRAWALPLITCVVTAAFIAARSRVSGKHSTPTTAALNSEQALLFDFPAQATGPGSVAETLAGRYLDIVHSFFVADSGRFTTPGLIVSLLFIVLVVALLVYTARHADRRLFSTLVAMVSGTVVLHLLGVMPLSPSRHQLVMFLPLALLAALFVQYTIGHRLPALGLPGLAFSWTLLALAYQLAPVLGPAQGMPHQAVKAVLARERVDQLVLAPCELEPLLYSDIRQRYTPLYRCGPKARHQLPQSSSRVAIWSASLLDDAKASAILADYSVSHWSLRPVFTDPGSPGQQFPVRGALYLATRGETGLTPPAPPARP